MNPTRSRLPNSRLLYERELRGWSQEDLAEQIGTTQKIVSRWERGESMPQPYYRQKLCKLFGKNAAELGFLNEPSSEDYALEESTRERALLKGNFQLSMLDS